MIRAHFNSRDPPVLSSISRNANDKSRIAIRGKSGSEIHGLFRSTIATNTKNAATRRVLKTHRVAVCLVIQPKRPIYLLLGLALAATEISEVVFSLKFGRRAHCETRTMDGALVTVWTVGAAAGR